MNKGNICVAAYIAKDDCNKMYCQRFHHQDVGLMSFIHRHWMQYGFIHSYIANCDQYRKDNTMHIFDGQLYSKLVPDIISQSCQAEANKQM